MFPLRGAVYHAAIGEGLRDVRGMGWIARAGQAVLAASIWLAVCVPLFAQSNSSISAQFLRASSLAASAFRFNEPRLPRSEPGGPGVALPSTAAPEGADKIKVHVRGIRIKGSTVYAPEELRVIYQDLIGHVVPLTAIYDVAQRITTKYGIDGYVLSRAIVPPQNLEESGATIQIQVIEGYVDKVVWPAFLKDFRNYFDYYAAQITAQRPANVRIIERYMLLASDLPGLQFKTSSRPPRKIPTLRRCSSRRSTSRSMPWRGSTIAVPSTPPCNISRRSRRITSSERTTP